MPNVILNDNFIFVSALAISNHKPIKFELKLDLHKEIDVNSSNYNLNSIGWYSKISLII